MWRAWLPEETPITRGRDDSFVQLVAHAIAEASATWSFQGAGGGDDNEIKINLADN